MATVQSPDGREWTVRSSRFRFPPWRSIDYNVDEWGFGLSVVLAEIIFFILCGIVVPLAIAIVEVPARAVTSLFSSTRYVTARATWPSEFELVLRTTRTHARAAKAHLVEGLRHGYENLEADGAEIVHVTRPHWLDDDS